MVPHLGRVVSRLCVAAFAVVAFASAAFAQPKLESSSLGHWRGYWQSQVNPTLLGPVDQFIATERNRRVGGSMEWLDAAGRLLRFDLAGTTSASCNFNYELKGPGGMRLLVHGMHEPRLATGEYKLFAPGLVDEGHIFLVQDFNGHGPDVRGHYMGTATSDVGEHPFALYITKQNRDPKTESLNGNFEGFAEAPGPEGEELRFDFDGSVDSSGHAVVVGLGPAGLFFVDANFTDEGPEESKMFRGEFMIIFADGSVEQGSLELSQTRIIGDTTGVPPGH
jgi:hypothetical protein